MTLVPFAPTPGYPFVFQPILDGSSYVATVVWNVWSQRWYVKLTDTAGNLVFVKPLTASPPVVPLVSLVWFQGRVTAVASVPHNGKIGGSGMLTVAGASPTAFCGLWNCFFESPTVFSYDLAANPDPALTAADGSVSATVPGTFSRDISMAAGYFNSTLVFRLDTETFEINP